MRNPATTRVLCLAAAAGGPRQASDGVLPRLMPRADRYDRLILRHAQENRLNPRLVKSIVAAESGFQPGATSPLGARGLMQVLPPTAREMGVSDALLWEAEPSVRAGTRYLNWLYRVAWKTYGLEGVAFRDGPDWAQRAVIAAYNGGPALLRRRSWPPQTVRYVRDVFHYYRSPATGMQLQPPPEEVAANL